MIDIHSHILFGVDDGPYDMSESVKLIAEARKQGIEFIICTPHYRHGMFAYNPDDVVRNFKLLREYASTQGITLFLGTEYHVNSHMIEYFSQMRCYTLAGTNYILTEYKEDSEYSYIKTHTYDAVSEGYIPILAHIERYKCLTQKPKLVKELRDIGAMTQVNADAVLGKDGFSAKHFTNGLIKQHQVDFVASDTHDNKNRACHLLEAYEYVKKKHGLATADKLFTENAKSILSNDLLPTLATVTYEPKKPKYENLSRLSYEDKTDDTNFTAAMKLALEAEPIILEREDSIELPSYLLINETSGRASELEIESKLPTKIELD